MNLLSLLLGSMTSQSSVQSLSQKTDVSDALIRKLLPLAIPLLIKALTKNASSQSGAASLLGALTQHKSTKPVANQIAAADTQDGEKILGHIFGSDYSSVIGQLAGQTGMNSSQVSSVLSAIAPVLLSGVSAANTTQSAKPSAASGLDLGSLMGMFAGASAKPSQAATSNELNGASLLSLLAALKG